MTFETVVEQTMAMLQRHGRVTYHMLKRQFDLDDAYFEDLKDAILYAYPLVVDDAGRGLVWTGEARVIPEANIQSGGEAERRLYALLRAVIVLLQCEKRITYRELKHIFGLHDGLLEEIREELAFKRLALDEEDKGLVWIGEAIPAAPPDTAITPSLAPPEAAGGVFSVFSESTSSTMTTDAPHDVSSIVEPVPMAPEAERRQLTVMFCDLADSTKLSQQLDPEDLREVIRAYHQTSAEVIERFDGTIAQYLGDGLLIYFGWPRAHEDDTQRALHAGLGMVEAITTTLNPRLEREKNMQLAVRLGIHTGPVVVGEMGGGGRHENLASGETVNIAARLEGLAAPNTVVISHVSARLVRDAFALEDLGHHALKGVADPMQLFRVLGPMEAHEEETVAFGVPFLVGRDEEVGLLLRRWEQSKAGLGQVVLISGEAGIGKSSLVATVRGHVLQEGHTRITFRCSPYHTNSALYPVITHLEQMLGFERDETPGTKLGKLEQTLRTTTLALEESVPLLATLLSVPLEDRYPAPTHSPQQQRRQTLDTLVTWMLEEAERQPVLAVWEDLHWADPSTLEMLGLVLEQTPTAPMLHVLSFRPEFEPPWPMRSHLTPITLNRLERPQVEALITHRAGNKRLPVEVVEHIVTKTDGVPLYVEELTKMLLASELLREEAGHYVLTGPLSTMAIPDTLQDSLMARLDQLGTAKEVAQRAAVLGREFTYDMLQAITSQDDQTTQTSLAQLVEAELLYQRGRPPRARYIFKHALIQEAAYASLLRRTRQQVHQQIAQIFEARFPETTAYQPELLAHHYTEAGDAERAVGYWYRAGQHASQRSAYAEAIAHLTQGLALLTTLPETPACREQELNLQVALGPALMAIKGYATPDVEHTYVRALELCQQLGDISQLCLVMRGLTLYHVNRGDIKTAYPLGEQLLRLAQSEHEPVLLLVAHYMLGAVLFLWGELVSARAHHTQALAIYDPHEHQALALRYGMDLGVASHNFLSFALWLLGYPDQAIQHSQKARTLAWEGSHIHTLAQAAVLAAFLHQFRREVSAVLEQTEAARRLTTEQGFAQWFARSMAPHGWARAMQGQSEQGIAEIRQGLATELATGSKLWQPYFLGLLAEAYGESGQPDAGLPLLTEALAVMDTTEVRCCWAELYRLKGALLLRRAAPDQAQAESCFHQALDIARRQKAKSWELRAATSLARLWREQDKRQDAYELLAPVYEWFTEGFDTADLKEAKALLEELR